MASDLALSIILPVHNAQTTLAAQVARVLETTAEVTALFELLIVDDGSTDHTGDVAHELAVEYPQVRVMRHAHHRGIAAAARVGVSQARGEIAFVYEGRTPLKASDLPRLWEAGARESPGWTAESQVIEAQLAEPIVESFEPRRTDAGIKARLDAGERSRIRALRDSGRSSPPPAKITPRRRSRQPNGR